MGDEAERKAREAREAREARQARHSTFRPREPSGRHEREPTGAFGTARSTGSRATGSVRVVSVRLRGDVAESEVQAALERAEETLDRLGRGRLLIDCRQVESWADGARDRVVRWARAQGDRVDRVAVATENVLWQMVLRTSSLASRQSMRGFSDIEDAFDWISGR